MSFLGAVCTKLKTYQHSRYRHSADRETISAVYYLTFDIQGIPLWYDEQMFVLVELQQKPLFATKFQLDEL